MDTDEKYWKNLSLEDKRKQYRCGDGYLQLKGIKTWTEYASKKSMLL